MKYLGAMLSADGLADSELSCRLGSAFADFCALQQEWNRANVSVRQKLHFSGAFVISKLKYGLSTLCLTMAQSRTLEGFYCRCLREFHDPCSLCIQGEHRQSFKAGRGIALFETVHATAFNSAR